MKLWILRPCDLPKENNPWEPWYDKVFGFVVCAEDENAARLIADQEAGDENRDGVGPWLSPQFSTCTELTAGETPGLIMRDEAMA